MTLISSENEIGSSYLTSLQSSIEPAYQFYWDAVAAGQESPVDYSKVMYYFEPVSQE